MRCDVGQHLAVFINLGELGGHNLDRRRHRSGTSASDDNDQRSYGLPRVDAAPEASRIVGIEKLRRLDLRDVPDIVQLVPIPLPLQQRDRVTRGQPRAAGELRYYESSAFQAGGVEKWQWH